jgi:hypothetical protein
MQGFRFGKIGRQRNLGNRVDLQVIERFDDFTESKRGISEADDRAHEGEESVDPEYHE